MNEQYIPWVIRRLEAKHGKEYAASFKAAVEKELSVGSTEEEVVNWSDL